MKTNSIVLEYLIDHVQELSIGDICTQDLSPSIIPPSVNIRPTTEQWHKVVAIFRNWTASMFNSKGKLRPM